MAIVTDERATAFGQALGDAMAVRKVKQRELAEALGVKQPTVSAWITGDAEPAPEVVFRAEEHLRLAPGTLSRHLGYLPPSAKKMIANVEDAILNDATLSAEMKTALLGAYHAVIGHAPPRRGRPRKSS